MAISINLHAIDITDAEQSATVHENAVILGVDNWPHQEGYGIWIQEDDAEATETRTWQVYYVGDTIPPLAVFVGWLHLWGGQMIAFIYDTTDVV